MPEEREKAPSDARINYQNNIQHQIRLIQIAPNESEQCKRVKMLERLTKALHDEKCKEELEELEEEFKEGKATAKEPTGYDDSKLWSVKFNKTMEKIPIIIRCLRRQGKLEEKDVI